MKAVLFHEYGGVDKLVYEDIATPEPGFGEVLVEIKAAGVNHFDHDIREGISRIERSLPHIPGIEGAGVIAALGPGVTQATVGERVVIYTQGCGTCRNCLAGREHNCHGPERHGITIWGSYAEYVKVRQHRLVRMPDALDFERAAATALCYGTSWNMIVERAGIEAGETVLVNAAGSGIGSAAVQIAKLHGTRVIASAGSDAKLDQAREIGADEAINYTDQNLFEEVMRLTDGEGVDLAVESVGGEVFQHSMRALRSNGRLVTCGAHAGERVEFDIIELFRKPVTLYGNHFGPRRVVDRVLNLVADGKLHPVIHGKWPLSEAREAATRAADRSFFGQMILIP